MNRLVKGYLVTTEIEFHNHTGLFVDPDFGVLIVEVFREICVEAVCLGNELFVEFVTFGDEGTNSFVVLDDEVVGGGEFHFCAGNESV